MTLFMQDSLSLCIALIFGAIIGIERELSDKAAGLRTNILICVGACLFMIVSKNFTGVVDADPTRIAAQIVTGIGFIGAGAIMHQGEQVSGLTTAATIWVVAAIGMAVGVRDYSIGGVTTALTLLVQVIFPRLDAYVDELRQRHTFKISSDLNDEGLEEVKTIFRDSDVKVLRRKLMKQKIVVRLLLNNPHVRELTY
jgi:putative Mg2+ transporter-C (MgtC) family protein